VQRGIGLLQWGQRRIGHGVAELLESHFSPSVDSIFWSCVSTLRIAMVQRLPVVRIAFRVSMHS
jgi:hypothetical protein